MPQTGKKAEHLRKTAEEHPEYREILSLFQDVFAHIEGKEDDTGIVFTLQDHHAAERILGGLPLVAAEGLSVDREKATRFLAGLLGVLQKASRDAEGKGELARLERALAEGALDLARLFTACLSRERTALDEAAASIPVSPPLLAFALEISLKTAMERAAESVDPASVSEWKEGYCPVCGSRAGMGELVGEEGKRLLSCSTCAFRWPFPRIKCPYCGNEDPESLSYFTAGEGPVRVGVCRKCSRYIKTRDSRMGHADVPLEAVDLTTLHLDLLAGKEGFERGK